MRKVKEERKTAKEEDNAIKDETNVCCWDMIRGILLGSLFMYVVTLEAFVTNELPMYVCM